MRKFTEEEIKYFDNPYKVAIIATVDEDGDIHMFNASTLMNKGDDEMMFGEFVRGKSKKLIYRNPKTGFFIMSVDQHFWTGSMDFTHSVTEGEDYVYMNQYQLFRFNTYFGVCEVHYADLKNISEMKKLNLPGVIANALKVMAMKPFFAGDKNKKMLRPWACRHLRLQPRHGSNARERRLPRRSSRHRLCGDRQAVRHGAAHLRRDRLQQEVRARGLPRRTARPELDLRKA